jgi:hypothetical protein
LRLKGGFSIFLRVTSCKKLTEEQTALRRFSTRGYRIPVNIRKNGRRTDAFQALGFPARNGHSAENDRNFRSDTAESGIPNRKNGLSNQAALMAKAFEELEQHTLEFEKEQVVQEANQVVEKAEQVIEQAVVRNK